MAMGDNIEGIDEREFGRGELGGLDNVRGVAKIVISCGWEIHISCGRYFQRALAGVEAFVVVEGAM
jgi:hypothetical protein